MRWITNSRADTVDKEMLGWMKRAGCWMIAYGFESGSQKVLDNAKKGITINQIKDAAKWTEEAGIKVWGYFIIGLPGETKESIAETIRLSKELPLYSANFAVGAPYPGTDFYNAAKMQAYDWSVADEYSNPYWETAHFTNRELKEHQECLMDKYAAKLTWHNRLIKAERAYDHG